MADLKTRFETAAEEVQDLAKRPDNDTLLELYAFHKQANTGDVSGKRPGFTNFVGRAKYDAWAKLEGNSKKEARQSYSYLVKRLKG